MCKLRAQLEGVSRWDKLLVMAALAVPDPSCHVFAPGVQDLDKLERLLRAAAAMRLLSVSGRLQAGVARCCLFTRKVQQDQTIPADGACPSACHQWARSTSALAAALGMQHVQGLPTAAGTATPPSRRRCGSPTRAASGPWCAATWRTACPRIDSSSMVRGPTVDRLHCEGIGLLSLVLS